MEWSLMRGLGAPVLLVPLALVGCANTGSATDYYVAQQDAQASDADPGSPERPFRTLDKACEVATAGDTVYVRQGVYREALIPKHFGEQGKPIVFQAYGTDAVTIKGSEVLIGLEKEGPNLWVKRPWTRGNYWEDWMREISVAPYGRSARIDEVFINEQPLEWVPSRAELKAGCFVWKGADQGGERPAVRAERHAGHRSGAPCLGNRHELWGGRIRHASLGQEAGCCSSYCGRPGPKAPRLHAFHAFLGVSSLGGSYGHSTLRPVPALS